MNIEAVIGERETCQRVIPTAQCGAKPREAPPEVPAGPRVRTDAASIYVPHRSGRTDGLAWADPGSVTILNTDAGPAASDLVWVLQSRDKRRSLIVEMGAPGEHDLLRAMQERLSGFDNMGVVEAMSAAENGSFLIWDYAQPPERP